MSIETPVKPTDTFNGAEWETALLPDDHEEPARLSDFDPYGIEAMQLRNEGIKEDTGLLAEGLGGGLLADAAAGAIAKRSNDILDVAMRVEAGAVKDLSIEDVSRAQRDLYFLLQAAVLAFGVRDTYEGLVASDTMVTPLSRKSTGRGSRRFVYRTTTNTLYDEGDYDDLPAEDRRAEMPYTGTLTVDIAPETRISLSYRPVIEAAREFHATRDVMQRGERMVAHEFDDCNLRIDVDRRRRQDWLSMWAGASTYRRRLCVRATCLAR